MKFSRTALIYFFAGFVVIFTAPVFAQYVWLDATGGKVFSDLPPPANVSNKRILQQPSKVVVSKQESKAEEKPVGKLDTDSGKTATKPQSPEADSQKNTHKDKNLEAAKKKIDDDEAAKKKAEQDKIDAAKADNCKRAKQAKATLDSGVLLSHTNAKGERGFMDEASRMVEAKRIQGIIAADCR